MNYFKLSLEVKSALGTPLAADTLWGHIAWGIRYHQGNDALEAWLARYDHSDPPLVLSDPLPSGHYPKPAVPQRPRPAQAPSVEDVTQFKASKKAEWISHQSWKEICQDLNAESLAAKVTTVEVPRPVQVAMTHAGVNRFTGGTAQLDGGALFSTQSLFYPQGACFEVWGASADTLADVQNWCEWGIEGGYGRDAATGLGHLHVVSIQAQTLPAVENANAVMLLGPAIPQPNDPSRGFFQSMIKSGRVGGSFAIGALPDGITQRQKFPVTMLKAGTVLVTDSNPHQVGRVISGVHEWSNIRQYGIAPTIPLHLSQELLNHPLLRLSDSHEEASA